MINSLLPIPAYQVRYKLVIDSFNSPSDDAIPPVPVVDSNEVDLEDENEDALTPPPPTFLNDMH